MQSNGAWQPASLGLNKDNVLVNLGMFLSISQLALFARRCLTARQISEADLG